MTRPRSKAEQRMVTAITKPRGKRRFMVLRSAETGLKNYAWECRERLDSELDEDRGERKP